MEDKRNEQFDELKKDPFEEYIRLGEPDKVDN